MCLMRYANNKSADQPAHPRSLISTFVVLVSVAEQACLNFTWSKIPEDTLSRDEAQMTLLQYLSTFPCLLLPSGNL